MLTESTSDLLLSTLWICQRVKENAYKITQLAHDDVLAKINTVEKLLQYRVQ